MLQKISTNYWSTQLDLIKTLNTKIILLKLKNKFD